MYQEDDCNNLPTELRSLIDDIRHLQLDRRPSTTAGTSDAAHGMSNKKAHEVRRTVDFVRSLRAETPALRDVRHAVDVGAGQVRSRPHVLDVRSNLKCHLSCRDTSRVR